MSRTNVDKIVDAVLYEGYILYPYRPSSAKNRQRFTFGRVYPEAYSEAQHGAEPCVMQTECLVEASQGAAPVLDVEVRFLHPMAREVGRLPEPLPTLPEGTEPDYDIVPSLQTNGEVYQTWQEAVERDISVDSTPLEMLTGEPQEIPIAIPASRELEPIGDREDRIVGVLVRRHRALEGTVEVSAARVGGLYKITVRVLNRTPVPKADLEDQDAVIMRTFASTHTILHVQEGAFVSLTDPPEEYIEAAETCQNEGTWPVLVGDEEAGERDTMLSSPIILYDYPEVAPESPGDFFDSTEIDELLTLRIMTMTDEEKREMRGADERARQILERTESMPEEQFMKMHGAIRSLEPASKEGRQEATSDEFDYFSDKRPLDEITIDGDRYCPGARVRIRPAGRGTDIMDLVLEGKTAVIEAVEQDFEGRVHLALVLDDDPGRELGLERQPGHRFFFSPEEVELLEEEAP